MPSQCPVCDGSSLRESMWHLFVDCRFVVGCWKECRMWSKLDSLAHVVDDHTELFLHALQKFSVDEVERLMTVA